MLDTVVKCSYEKCRHSEKTINKDEAVEIEGCYYHADCAKDINNINEIERLFQRRINKTVVLKDLRTVINSIVYTKNIDSDYLLFALKYAIKNHVPLKRAPGLHYLIDNYSIKEAWRKEQTRKYAAHEFKANNDDEPDFKINFKEKGIDNIFE